MRDWTDWPRNSGDEEGEGKNSLAWFMDSDLLEVLEISRAATDVLPLGRRCAKQGPSIRIRTENWHPFDPIARPYNKRLCWTSWCSSRTERTFAFHDQKTSVSKGLKKHRGDLDEFLLGFLVPQIVIIIPGQCSEWITRLLAREKRDIPCSQAN